MEGATPPRQPRYVMRGHTAAIHTLAFSPDNGRLLTGDADGWVVSWGLAYRRPVAAWRAHKNAALGLAWWGSGVVISHGRDSKLIVWQLRQEDEQSLDKTLPADQAASGNRKPSILYELTINTMNFCSFASYPDPLSLGLPTKALIEQDALLIAVPHTLDSEAIDIFHLPSTHRLSTIPVPKFIESGMAMALQIRADNESTCVVAAYESGHVAYYANSSRKGVLRSGDGTDSESTTAGERNRPPIYTDRWECIYLSRPHSQPVLSLCVSLDKQYLASSGADSVIATHLFLPVIESSRDKEETMEAAHPVEEPYRASNTSHPGQQGLSTGGNGAFFASAGWDGMVRIYTWNESREKEVLEWHRDGVYATAFAHTLGDSISPSQADSANGTVARRQGTLAARRERQARMTPWLAVGGKDGKVSLWEIDS